MNEPTDGPSPGSAPTKVPTPVPRRIVGRIGGRSAGDVVVRPVLELHAIVGAVVAQLSDCTNISDSASVPIATAISGIPSMSSV
jgi:hypothetical protein